LTFYRHLDNEPIVPTTQYLNYQLTTITQFRNVNVLICKCKFGLWE